MIVRQIVGHATGRLTIKCGSRDKDMFPDEEITKDEAGSLVIIGRLRHILGDR